MFFANALPAGSKQYQFLGVSCTFKACAGVLFAKVSFKAACCFAGPQDNWWLPIKSRGTPPSRRNWHSMAWSNAAGGFYIFGGYDGSSSLDAGAKRSELCEVLCGVM